MWYSSNVLKILLIFNHSKIGAVAKLMIDGISDKLDWPKSFVGTALTIFLEALAGIDLIQ